MDRLLIYYGWLNAFNSAQNQWNNEKVAQELAKYDLLVFGDGVQNPSHGDYSNTQVIIPRIKTLNPSTCIFGYVTVNQSASNFEDKVDQWEDLEVDGIFMDEAGYDYGTTRDDFNSRVNYVHANDYANTCFVNAWNMDHILGTANDPSYPNSTYNSKNRQSQLDSSDWYLLESFAVNTDSYTSNNGYAPKADWLSRGEKAVSLRDSYGISVASCGIISDSDSAGQSKYEFTHNSAVAFELEGNGTSDSNYGASSAASKMWTSPSVLDLGGTMNPASVTVDADDADVYYRYGEKSRVVIDHSTSAQTSSIQTW